MSRDTRYLNTMASSVVKYSIVCVPQTLPFECTGEAEVIYSIHSARPSCYASIFVKDLVDWSIIRSPCFEWNIKIKLVHQLVEHFEK